MKNNEFIKNAVDTRFTETAKNGNLSTRGDGYLYSYDARIAYFDQDGNPVVTSKKYSVTTSRHTGRVAFEIKQMCGVDAYTLEM